jgi:hypothetical protein
MESDIRTNLFWVYSSDTKNIVSLFVVRVLHLEYADDSILITLVKFHFHPVSILFILLFNGFIMEAT